MANYLSIVCILQNYINLSSPSKVDAKEALKKNNTSPYNLNDIDQYAQLFSLTIVVEGKGPYSPRAHQSLSPTPLNYPTILSPEACLAFQISSPPANISAMKGVPVDPSSGASEALQAPESNDGLSTLGVVFCAHIHALEQISYVG